MSKKEVHKTRGWIQAAVEYVLYSGYVNVTYYRIPCMPKHGGGYNVSYYWKPVTCKKCKKMGGKL